MTVEDLVGICEAEGVNPANMNLVMTFADGTTFELSSVDGSEAGDPNNICLVPVPVYATA